jgi:hypothetical protein
MILARRKEEDGQETGNEYREWRIRMNECTADLTTQTSYDLYHHPRTFAVPRHIPLLLQPPEGV